ncbi:MAG: FAD-binding oxidoreductase [Candidatus Eisenbacteria bacterium]|uniref:D-lactate dehydrogenase (cytochrome) n=1 Tax=Eiseniibacteriota bacterium TaxID=2212470 RepID=A0A7Y2EBI9_UNCEI|nr:FAD-binding oxidoreductase [Candidatus Eisenbacteria bacterium]
MKPAIWKPEALGQVPLGSTGIRPGEAGWESYRGDVVMEGHPDLVLRPKEAKQVEEILVYAAAHKIPVTMAGGQSSLTGSSVAESGILLATEGMQNVYDIGKDPASGETWATVDPGIFLGDFQRAMEQEGWMYPPDPTSRNEARLGATIATNATGEDTLYYGPTRKWVRELEVITGTGERRVFSRNGASLPAEEKATAGYYHWGDPIDLFIGSEGTLGAITKVRVCLTPKPASVFAGMAFFPTLELAMKFVVEARQNADLDPRALEIMDRGALDLVGKNPEGIQWPEAAAAAIYFKQDAVDAASAGNFMEAWYAQAESVLATSEQSELLDALFVVEDKPGLDRLRSFRHRVPATLHEVVRGYREHGGGKIGTDWWVPYTQIGEVLTHWCEVIQSQNLQYVIFGHVGNGHPHVNFLARTGEEKEKAGKIVKAMCAEAVKRGGGVAGEHGLGKLKRDLLEIQFPQGLETMREIKNTWDPHWILGRGNLLATPTD